MAMKELKEILLSKFPAYIDKIILFGSQTTKMATPFSDYDILVILKKKYDWKLENKIYNATYDIDIEFDIITDIKLISSQELKTIKGKQPFIQKAINEGIEI